jgi:hypothetical protein
MRTLWKFVWLCLAAFLLILLFAPKPKPVPEVKVEKLDYSRPIFTTYGTIVCPTSLLFDVRADHSPDKVVQMFYLAHWNRSGEAEKLGCTELQPGVLVKAAPYVLERTVSVEIPGSADRNLFTLEDELTNKVPGQSDTTRADLATAHINKPPDVPLRAATSSDLGTLLVTIPSPIAGPTLMGPVMAASDSQGDGAIICPDANAMALAFSSIGANHKEESIGASLKPYGCSYFPPGTPMVSEGRNAANTLAIVTVELSDGSKLNGVTFPSYIVQSQQQREQAEREAMEKQQIAQRAEREMEGARQSRYREIMQPEEQRHASAVAAEESHHDFVIRALKVARDSFNSMPTPNLAAMQREQKLLIENGAAVQREAERHDAAVQQENQRYSSAQATATEHAARSLQPQQ